MRLLLKRRWLRFSVRTLLVAVTIFCVWLGWQVSIVRERKQLIEEVTEGRGWRAVLADEDDPNFSALRVPFVRRLLGDSGFYELEIYNPDPKFIARVERAFPEADIYLADEEVQGADYRSLHRGRLYKIPDGA